MYHWLIGKGRIYLSPDLTTLGLPGWGFWHAHLRYVILYGREDWEYRRAWAQERHLERVKEHNFQLAKNWRGSTYVAYIKRDQNSLVS